MSFNSLAFLVFLPLTVAVHYVLPHRVRWVWLLAASYLFYMFKKPEMGLLILSVTVVTYSGGLLVDVLLNKHGRKKLAGAIAGITVAVLFLCLGFFKYFSFLSENVNALIGLAGGRAFDTIDVVLPVGISFFTFQAVSYVIDIKRGKIRAERHFGYFALFISFFPQLVAGPIERPDVLIPQLRAKRYLRFEYLSSGSSRLLIGFFKKLVVADVLAGPVKTVFDDPVGCGSAVSALGAVLFGIQIFCDFSGYTDIATGAAELLGIRLSKNFDKPYSAVSPSDFWRRWHISLSSWFRDYVYIPLGGSRKGALRTILNMTAVFLLSGLWHGAAWHFVLWGLLHGIVCGVDSATFEWRNRSLRKMRLDPEGLFVVTVRRILTFLTVTFLWIFFRAGSVKSAADMIAVIFGGIKGKGLAALSQDTVTLLTVALSIVILIVIDSGHANKSFFISGEKNTPRSAHKAFCGETSPAAAVLLLWTIALCWLFLAANTAESSFIYFQF
ncbi:MAG: MBOAT family protein [Clostridia bacterium]|nr:MBOAT family protein [Clostridia bacterium]